MKKRIITFLITAACAFACLLALSACGSSDENDFVGEWQIESSGGPEVTVVFTGSEFKMVGQTWQYSVESDAKILKMENGGAESESKYSFSSDKQTLTLEQSNGAGGTDTTVFHKLSDDGNVEPSVDGVTEDEL